MNVDNTTDQQNQTSAEQQPATEVKQPSRRKFLMQAGVGSLPVLMSMKSGDAWGCIGLECDFGTTNLSGTQSAVVSARATAGESYVVPKWSSISNIQSVVSVDFGRDINSNRGFLLSHYDYGYLRTTTYNSKTKTNVHTYSKVCTSKPQLSQWQSAANSYKSNGTLYIRSSHTSTSYSKFTDSRGILSPASYNGHIITGQTNMGLFFADMQGVTVWNALKSTNDFVKYVTAAFIGAIWQEHPVWKTGWSSGVKNHNPNCYPNASEIISAYNMVISRNAASHPQGKTGALKDMGILFKMYTK